MSHEEILNLYHKAYDTEPFVIVRHEPPATKHVVGTNYVHVYPTVVGGARSSARVIDNLTKGAAGQALQNMNLLFGHEETAGLK